jgi:hypothetical protein
MEELGKGIEQVGNASIGEFCGLMRAPIEEKRGRP